MTTFQKRLMDDKQTLWDITKIWHPTIPDSYTTRKNVVSVKDDKVSAYPKFMWVCLDFRVRGFGEISIGINNAESFGLWGADITKERMQEALSNKEIWFRSWRFCLDKDCDVNREQDNVCSELTTKLLLSRGYLQPSVKEFYDDYYSD